jgi:hypothetical protein
VFVFLLGALAMCVPPRGFGGVLGKVFTWMSRSRVLGGQGWDSSDGGWCSYVGFSPSSLVPSSSSLSLPTYSLEGTEV